MKVDLFLCRNWIKLSNSLSIQNKKKFNQLVVRYSDPNRYYHNLNHLKNLFEACDKYYPLLTFPKTVGYAIWYHDVIYDVTKEDNELKSAEYAYNDLKHLYVEPHIIKKCCKMIIATKNHQLAPDLDCFDSKFFLDIDLLILSSPRKKYIEYLKQIRKEYNIYSNEVYNQGRKKLLLKLLQRRIYQTELFFNQFEEIAKRNILYELSLL